MNPASPCPPTKTGQGEAPFIGGFAFYGLAQRRLSPCSARCSDDNALFCALMAINLIITDGMGGNGCLVVFRACE